MSLYSTDIPLEEGTASLYADWRTEHQDPRTLGYATVRLRYTGTESRDTAYLTRTETVRNDGETAGRITYEDRGWIGISWDEPYIAPETLHDIADTAGRIHPAAVVHPGSEVKRPTYGGATSVPRGEKRDIVEGHGVAVGPGDTTRITAPGGFVAAADLMADGLGTRLMSDGTLVDARERIQERIDEIQELPRWMR